MPGIPHAAAAARAAPAPLVPDSGPAGRAAAAGPLAGDGLPAGEVSTDGMCGAS